MPDKPKRDPNLFRSKELDSQGSRGEVMRDGSIRLMPPEGTPHPGIKMTRMEFVQLAQFVSWCLKDLDQETGPSRSSGI